MKGLELSERYFFEVGAPLIEEKFPRWTDRIAAGLVGDGSECFGFDDEISRDHDWGAAFCLWLSREDYDAVGADLQRETGKLPGEFAGFKARQQSDWGEGRTGVFEIGEFYKRFIGFDRPPSRLNEWRIIPEENLAVATNGKIFSDLLGEFTAFRKALKQFYPEDIRLKKIAARCMAMAQAGQYNYGRCIKRGEYVAALVAESNFVNASVSMVFLLNREYKPFYKWMHKALKRLPVLGEEMYDLLRDLTDVDGGRSEKIYYGRKFEIMERICHGVIGELREEGLSDGTSDFLLDHGPLVQARINDPVLRSMNTWAE
jgi:hypothetical protein